MGIDQGQSLLATEERNIRYHWGHSAAFQRYVVLKCGDRDFWGPPHSKFACLCRGYSKSCSCISLHVTLGWRGQWPRVCIAVLFAESNPSALPNGVPFNMSRGQSYGPSKMADRVQPSFGVSWHLQYQKGARGPTADLPKQEQPLKLGKYHEQHVF